MINYKKLKEITPKDIGRAGDRCYNCPVRIVLKELFRVDVQSGCSNSFNKNILPLIPKKYKKINFNICTNCRKGAIIVYEIITRKNKI